MESLHSSQVTQVSCKRHCHQKVLLVYDLNVLYSLTPACKYLFTFVLRYMYTSKHALPYMPSIYGVHAQLHTHTYVYIGVYMHTFTPEFETKRYPISISPRVFFCFYLQPTCFAQFYVKTHQQKRNIHTILRVTLCQNSSVSRHIY